VSIVGWAERIETVRVNFCAKLCHLLVLLMPTASWALSEIAVRKLLPIVDRSSKCRFGGGY